MHVFASVRPARRLLAQFDFGSDDAAFLDGLGWAPVVTLRATTWAGTVEVTVVEEPQQMADLVRSLPRKMRASCNVSLAFLGDTEWLRRWNRSLTRWHITGLFDLSPSSLFDLWRREGERVVFAPSSLGGSSELEAGALVVLRVGRSPVPLLLVGTPVTAGAVEQHLSTRMPRARHDTNVLKELTELQVPVSRALTLDLGHA